MTLPSRPAASRRRGTTTSQRQARRPGRKAIVEFSEVPRASRPLKIALFGGTGHVGSRIAEEALARGHHVTCLVRHPDQLSSIHPNLRVVRGDVMDASLVEEVARDHDVVASAIAPPAGREDALVEAARSLLEAARRSGRRVVAVGGAGSLESPSGQALVDSPSFPPADRPIAMAHRDALRVFMDEGGEDWTVLSPAPRLEPGVRTGEFRWGTNRPLGGPGGEGRISMEDFAVAFVDELESGEHPGRRVTVGY